MIGRGQDLRMANNGNDDRQARTILILFTLENVEVKENMTNYNDPEFLTINSANPLSLKNPARNADTIYTVCFIFLLVRSMYRRIDTN